MRSRWRYSISIVLLVFLGRLGVAQAASAPPPLHQDSDGDGLSDDLEQRLLEQFVPTFMIARDDCSNVPSEFVSGVANPTVEQENGTIYGQVSPAKTEAGDDPVVEIHYFHLWETDCGAHGHALDSEHVSVMVRASGVDAATARWRATYWYAAAHEDTVCDVSQIVRATTLHAEEHGAKVWISAGKHASYLNEELCHRGCGADRCEDMVPLHVGSIVNLGELGHPMNGSVFVSSSRWPLAEKMESTNFPAAAVARLESLPETDIAWFHPGRHPAQGVIAISSSTGHAIARGGHDADGAIAGAEDSADVAMSVAENSTGSALGKSYRATVRALGASARHVGKALGVPPKKPE